MRQVAIALAALSATLFASMTWYIWSVMKPNAGGLAPFDLRFLGYSPEQALTYLKALQSPGRAFYLLEMRILDTAFPLAFAGLGVLVVFFLSGGRPAWQRVLLTLPVLAYGIVDLAENTSTRALVMAGPEAFDAGLAAKASLLTQTKFALILASLALAYWLWRSRKP